MRYSKLGVELRALDNGDAVYLDTKNHMKLYELVKAKVSKYRKMSKACTGDASADIAKVANRGEYLLRRTGSTGCNYYLSSPRGLSTCTIWIYDIFRWLNESYNRKNCFKLPDLIPRRYGHSQNFKRTGISLKD